MKIKKYKEHQPHALIRTGVLGGIIVGSTETQPAEGARLTHAVDVPYYHFFLS